MTVASLPPILRCRRCPKNLRDLVRRQPPQPELAASLEQLVDREVALEDEVAAIFDLGDRVEARQIDLLALFLGELRPQNEGPVVEPLANDFGAQLVCGSLQCGNVINSQERIIILSKPNLRTIELLLDEAVPIEVVRRLEGEERCHTHDEWPRSEEHTSELQSR